MKEAKTLSDSLVTGLALIYGSKWSRQVAGLLFLPTASPGGSSIKDALQTIEHGIGEELPNWLLPLAWVDERSIACVVIEDQPWDYSTGQVLRLHLSPVPEAAQLSLLDVDPLLYITSLDEELRARGAGLNRVLDQIGPAYEKTHLTRQKRPRNFVVRPVRIACQNVIVGLAAIAQDSAFDGLSVPAWQTCEVPHVATHEGNRALAALTLCDAFQNGGTMEIRFDRKARITHKGSPLDFDGHPEKRVPASLRRFGRSVGVTLGEDDAASISPREARELFLAITPMPSELRARVDDAVEHLRVTPERICFLLLSQVWREIEMDYLLSVSSRVAPILSGGSDWVDRFARQAESEVCRSAAAVGMLHRRLNSTDAASSPSLVRVVEDRTNDVVWTIRPKNAAVTFSGLDPSDAIPLMVGLTGVDALTVFPRSVLTPEVIAEMLAADAPGHKALLVPADIPLPDLDPSFTVLRCPDRLADIDKSIEERLLKSRISRG